MQCNDERLSQLLRLPANMDGPVDAELTSHLDSCTYCQTRLLELAGDTQWSSVVREALSVDPDDDVPTEFTATSGSIVIALDASLADDTPAVCEPLTLDFLSPATHPEMLGRLDRYEIERVIGAGGMGIVLKGFDTELHRPVAIKVLAPHLAGSGAARSRFAREAQAAAAIVHEHVVPIHNVAIAPHSPTLDSRQRARGSADTRDGLLGMGLPYLVMPYIAGQSLQTRIDEQGPLPIKEIVRIGYQTALGLSAAHAQGIVHRDVKPANIMLDGDVDRVRISDFGLARAADDASITRSGIIAGTPQYMSPEQTRGEAIDARSDLFSLGSVLYTLCTGRPPFRADTTMGVLRRISDDEPRPIQELNSEIPLWLVRIVQRLMAKSPDDRFASADDVAQLLGQCLAHLHQPAISPLPGLVPLPRTLLIRQQRHRQLGWIAAIATALSVIVGAVVFNGRQPSDTPAAQSSLASSPVNSSSETPPRAAIADRPSADVVAAQRAEVDAGEWLLLAPNSPIADEDMPSLDHSIDPKLDVIEQELHSLRDELHEW